VKKYFGVFMMEDKHKNQYQNHKNNDPLVSVILPTFNGNKTLYDAINSIIRQDYSNLELFIVDDYSEVDIKSIVDQFENKDIRILYIRNDRNIGLAASINRGIKESMGKYVARMDDDDFSLPQRISKQVYFLETYPAVDVLGTGVAFYNQDLQFIRNHLFPLDHENIIKFLSRGNPLAHPTVMMRRSFLEQSGGYNQSLRRMEDLELWGRMSSQSKYANLPDILLRHRVRRAKTLSALKLGISIRMRNGRLLGTPFSSFVWTIIYVLIEVARHFGYRQRGFRQSFRVGEKVTGFTE